MGTSQVTLPRTTVRPSVPPLKRVKTPANIQADGTLALPPNLVDGARDEALDVCPVSEDLRE